jgi:alanyl-tRNA synthetase
MKTLRQRIDELKSKHANVIAVAGTTQNNKVLLAAGVSKALTDQVNASSLINHVASHVGGKGGGRPDMAQAGGNQPENIESALNSVKPWVKSQLT